MNLRYIGLAIASLPLLPIMYMHGKRIRNSVPRLPEAKGPTGRFQYSDTSNSTLNLIALGESTIAGVGVETHEQGFTGTFAKELGTLLQMNVNWKVYAHSGYTAKLVSDRLVPKIKEKQVDLIIIGLGANDAFTLNTPAKWTAHIRSIITSLHQQYPHAKIIFCHVPPIKEFPAFSSVVKFTIGNLVEILGLELQKVQDDYEYVYYLGEKITLEKWMNRYQLKGDKKDFFSDGVHPSKLTYQIWAKDIVQKISSNPQLMKIL